MFQFAGGMQRAGGEYSLACAVHNFKKIVKAVINGAVRLERGQLAPAVA